MASDADRPTPVKPSRRAVRWRLVLLFLALGSVAMVAGAQKLGYEFRKYLAFTTADIDAVLPRPPDRSQATTRATVRADKVYSRGCGVGVAYCTQPKGETVELPRSVTFEFPTALVSGLGKNNSSVHLRMWHRTFAPMSAKPDMGPARGAGEVRGAPDGIRDDPRAPGALLPESELWVTLGNYYSDSYDRWDAARSYPPPCDVTRDSAGTMLVRHGPDYRLQDAATRRFQCQSIQLYETAFIVRQFDKHGALQYEFKCTTPRTLCHGLMSFENWAVGFDVAYEAQTEFYDIYKRLTELLKRSVVARSYTRPDGER